MINLAMALRVEAMRLSRNAVRAQMKAKGMKVSYVSSAEITRAALAWLRDHPEVRDEAFAHVLEWQLRYLRQRLAWPSSSSFASTPSDDHPNAIAIGHV
jgi:hypothetical protein